MPDREKVIKGLYACTTISENGVTDGDCKICPYDKGYATGECWVQMNRDAIALLKEQEAVEPKQVGLHGKEDWYGLVCVCPDCKAEWMSDDADIHFCPKCGRAVKWE